jgi:cell division protein FtsB
MREFQERKRKLRLLYSKTSIVFLLILLILAVRAVWSVYGKEKQSMLLKEQSEQRLTDLQSQDTQLATTNAELTTPAGIDRQIREDYHMASPGEQLAVILNEPSATSTAAPIQNVGFINQLGAIWHSFVRFFQGVL